MYPSPWVSPPPLTAEEILADSAVLSDDVPSRDGGYHRTRGFECWVAQKFLEGLTSESLLGFI